MIRFACKDCLDRHFGCHDECEKYNEIKKKNDELKNKAFIDNEVRFAGIKESIKRMKSRRKSNGC